MRTADFDFPLPQELIAQNPMPERDQSRLLVLSRQTGQVEHRIFSDLIDYLQTGDTLVLNDTRVIAARLRGSKAGTGGHIEVLLLEQNALNDWWGMLRPGKRVRPGTSVILHDSLGIPTQIEANVLAKNREGHCRLQFSGTPDVLRELDRVGEIPLPPYIKRSPGRESIEDCERYQTVYANTPGSVAAPTAGLHFTQPLLDRIRGNGVHIHYLTLHVGLGTFAPVQADEIAAHTMHEEHFELTELTAAAITASRSAGGRVVAVGTTTVRVLESVCAANAGRLVGGNGSTRIFIHPPFPFRVVDAMVTNFHLPRSTLLMLVSAFAAPGKIVGRDLVLSAYAEAIRERYRFFSYGDAMLIR